MEKFINLLSNENRKSIIIYIFLNIILIFFETFGIALIPLIIDFVISKNPLLPQYLGSMGDLIVNIDKKDLLVYLAIIISLLFLIKNLYILSLVYYQESLAVKFRFELKKNFFIII